MYRFESEFPACFTFYLAGFVHQHAKLYLCSFGSPHVVHLYHLGYTLGGCYISKNDFLVNSYKFIPAINEFTLFSLFSDNVRSVNSTFAEVIMTLHWLIVVTRVLLRCCM